MRRGRRASRVIEISAQSLASRGLFPQNVRPAATPTIINSRADQLLITGRIHGSRTTTALHWYRHRRGLRAGCAGFRADLPRHQCGEFRAGRILDGRGLPDGGVRRRSGVAVLAVISASARRHGAVGRDLQSRGLLSAASPHLPAGYHRDHWCIDFAGQFRARDLRPAAAGAGGLVRDARHPARTGLSRQPVSLDHRGHDDPGGVQLLVLRAHHAGQEAAGDLAGQGDGVVARHFRLHHDHDHLHLFGGAWRPRGHPGGADPVRLDPDGLDDRAQSLRRHHHRRLRRRCRCDHRRTGARRHRNLRCRLYFSALQGRLCFPGAGAVSGVPASGHLWRTRRGESMSAPSENMPITVPATRAKPLLIRHLPYFIGAALVVALAATMRFDGYILNILMQATTFAIAVFGLSVVLGLCGQINLAQAAFFGFGAYAVGIGTSDYHISYWLCLAAGCVMALFAGAVLGMSTLRLGGHYLAMVTISFQQIVTLVMINAIWLTHGPDGVP